MTIRNRELNNRLGYIERCAEVAPEGTYTEAKRGAAAIKQAMDAVEAAFREHGFKAGGCDCARNLEAAIYSYLLECNPDAYGLMTGEGFGKHVDGPAGERILAQAVYNRNLFRDLGLLPVKHDVIEGRRDVDGEPL